MKSAKQVTAPRHDSKNSKYIADSREHYVTWHTRSVIDPDFNDTFVLVRCGTLIFRFY
jgi:hypothetical protein